MHRNRPGKEKSSIVADPAAVGKDAVPLAAAALVPNIIEVIPSAQVQNSWDWWFQNITPQPDLNNNGFVFDQKMWGPEPTCLLHGVPDHICHVANLYLISQFTADPIEILAIIEGHPANICVSEPGVDPQTKKLIENSESFRHSLSEHLAFWAQLASIIKTNLYPRFVVVLPNAKPTDPGPDGLSLSYTGNNEPVIEIRSVKNSINDPCEKIASAGFRRGMDPDPSVPPEDQLDEFYIIVKDGYGFVKLERMLVSAFHCLHESLEGIFRIGLIRNRSSLNAMLVGDIQYAAGERFDIYSRIPRRPDQKIATYLGSDEWQTFAEETRQAVVDILGAVGVI